MAAAKKKAQQEYGAQSITVLEGLEAVRKRPGMYIGSTGERGLHHLVYEVVDNAVDEALAGYCDRIDVDPARRRRRAGPGQRPWHPRRHRRERGTPAVEVVLTVLHAGGKFGGGGYAVSGGLHGVGVSVVNALSSKVQVDVQTEGFHWTQEYHRGVPQADLLKGAATEVTGTQVNFWADDEIFETTEYDYATLARRFQEMAFLNRGLTIAMTDERQREDAPRGRRRRRRGVRDQAARRRRRLRVAASPTSSSTSTRPSRHRAPDRHRLRVRGHRRTISAEVALQWNGGFNDRSHVRQHDQHDRGRDPRRGLPFRADLGGEQVRPRLGSCSRTRTRTSPVTTIREGLDRDRVGEAR